jgi:hypothetical protein
MLMLKERYLYSSADRITSPVGDSVGDSVGDDPSRGENLSSNRRHLTQFHRDKLITVSIILTIALKVMDDTPVGHCPHLDNLHDFCHIIRRTIFRPTVTLLTLCVGQRIGKHVDYTTTSRKHKIRSEQR